jgi:hypothetical protein
MKMYTKKVYLNSFNILKYVNIVFLINGAHVPKCKKAMSDQDDI